MSAPAPIVTVTINPALDVSTSTPVVVETEKLRCGPTQLDAGGGGVNVARALALLGGSALAIYAAGGPTGVAYHNILAREKIDDEVIPIEESTRESFTVSEESTGKQFRFVLQGPTLSQAEWQGCLDAISRAAVAGGFIIASGSLPPGVPEDFYARVARIAHHAGAKCVIDSTGSPLRQRSPRASISSNPVAPSSLSWWGASFPPLTTTRMPHAG